MKKIKVLKDTPFHKKDEIIDVNTFSHYYNQAIIKPIKEDDIIQWLEKEYQLEQEFVKYGIGSWFQVVELLNLEPLQFIHEDLWYVKGFDGMYTAFVSPMFYKSYIQGDKNCYVKKISTHEARNLIEQSKYKKEILYCTNDVNKKL